MESKRLSQNGYRESDQFREIRALPVKLSYRLLAGRPASFKQIGIEVGGSNTVNTTPNMRRTVQVPAGGFVGNEAAACPTGPPGTGIRSTPPAPLLAVCKGGVWKRGGLGFGLKAVVFDCYDAQAVHARPISLAKIIGSWWGANRPTICRLAFVRLGRPRVDRLGITAV